MNLGSKTVLTVMLKVNLRALRPQNRVDMIDYKNADHNMFSRSFYKGISEEVILRGNAEGLEPRLVKYS